MRSCWRSPVQLLSTAWSRTTEVRVIAQRFTLFALLGTEDSPMGHTGKGMHAPAHVVVSRDCVEAE